MLASTAWPEADQRSGASLHTFFGDMRVARCSGKPFILTDLPFHVGSVALGWRVGNSPSL